MKQTHCLNCQKPVYTPHPKQGDTAECDCSHWIFLNGHWRWKRIKAIKITELVSRELKLLSEKIVIQSLIQNSNKDNFPYLEIVRPAKNDPALPLDAERPADATA